MGRSTSFRLRLIALVGQVGVSSLPPSNGPPGSKRDRHHSKWMRWINMLAARQVLFWAAAAQREFRKKMRTIPMERTLRELLAEQSGMSASPPGSDWSSSDGSWSGNDSDAAHQMDIANLVF